MSVGAVIKLDFWLSYDVRCAERAPVAENVNCFGSGAVRV